MPFLRDEEKKIIVERYLDIEWCDEVGDLRCVHCNRVAIQPYVSNCEHLVCKMCKQFYSDEGQRLNCPRCQERIRKLKEKNFDVEVKIHRLKMSCPNKKYGCNYADELRKIPSHLIVCNDSIKAATFRLRTSKLQVEDPKTYTMADVVNQLTNLNATLREVKNKVDRLEKKSEDIDSKFNTLIKKDKKNEENKADVQLAIKSYTEEFQSMRSKFESVREIIEQNELLHQQKMAFKMDKMKSWMDSKILRNQKPEVTPLKAETYEWTIKDVEKNIINDKRKYESEVFEFTGCKYDIKSRIKDYEGRLMLSLQFKDGDKINRFLYKDAFTTATYTVRDQSDVAKKEDIVSKAYSKFGDGCGLYNWIFEDLQSKKILFPPYVKDDCIKITILLEPSSMDQDFISKDGVLLWRVDNYKKRKEEQKLENIYSPPFYTSPEGYKVRILLSILQSQTISVEMLFLNGEHDATLSSFFKYKTTATLINQTDTSKNLVESMSNQLDDDYNYQISLQTRNTIESDGFIKYDSLLLKVVIETAS